MPGDSPTASFIEELALSLESFGWPRMAGRILAYLLICSPARQTQQGIAAALSASKASVSTMLRLLERAESVVKSPIPGDRRDYYRLRDDAWLSLARRQLSLRKKIALTAEKGLTSLNLGEDGQTRLREFVKFQRWYVEGAEKALDGWPSDPDKTN